MSESIIVSPGVRSIITAQQMPFFFVRQYSGITRANTNTLTTVVPQILAQGLLALRGACVMPSLVNSNWGMEVSKKGSTIDVPIPSAIATNDVTPSYVAPDDTGVVPTEANIPLDQWKEAPFFLNDKERTEAMEGIIPMQASEAIKSLANTVNSYIFGLYPKIYGYEGTAGTTPFASDTTFATALRKRLNVQLAPTGGDRHVVLDPDAEANALNLRAFNDVNFGVDANDIREGKMARKFGFNWAMDQLVPTHTTGATGTWLTDQADIAIGDTGIHIDGATAVATAGDIFTVAGDAQTYTILTCSALTGTDADITFSPAAKVAWADSAAITFKADHVLNLGFHRDCFAFATRPLEDDDATQLGSIIRSAVDPISGLTLRLEVTRQHKRVRWSFDILYGGLCIRPELGVRGAG